jgi:hypothetical protein
MKLKRYKNSSAFLLIRGYFLKTAKEYSLNLVKTADLNFLMALKGIKLENVTKQVHPEINTILWIVGHCVSHMDAYLSSFTGRRKFSEEQGKFFTYSAPKQTMENGCSYSIIDIIDTYLEISREYFEYLENLPEAKFNEKPSEKSETYYNRHQRLALHILGHTGQIVVIRRMLGNPTIEYWQDKEKGWSFVSGIYEEDRLRFKEFWLKWWNEFKENK